MPPFKSVVNDLELFGTLIFMLLCTWGEKNKVLPKINSIISAGECNGIHLHIENDHVEFLNWDKKYFFYRMHCTSIKKG